MTEMTSAMIKSSIHYLYW